MDEQARSVWWSLMVETVAKIPQSYFLFLLSMGCCSFLLDFDAVLHSLLIHERFGLSFPFFKLWTS